MDPITFKTTVENFHNNLWSHFIVIPKELGEPFIEGDNRRVLCSVNGNTVFHAALMHREDGYFILLNKQLTKGYGLTEGDQVQIILEKDRSEFGLPMPETFEVLLAQDEEGKEYFEQLTMGKQRSLIYIVGKVKNLDSQLAKGLAIMHHLKEAKGELDFRRLNDLIKHYNNLK